MTTSRFSSPATIEKRVAVLVGDRAHVAGAVAQRAGDESTARRCRDRRAPRGRPAGRRDRTETAGRAPGRSRTSAAARRGRPALRRAGPSHRWPAPGIAHDARHSSTSAPDCVLFGGGGAHGRLVYLIRSAVRRPRTHDPRDRRRRAARPDAARIQFAGHVAGRPFVDERRGRRDDERRARASQRAARARAGAERAIATARAAARDAQRATIACERAAPA